MKPASSIIVPKIVGRASTGFLERDTALEILFDKILDQFAATSHFSSSVSAPSIFIVYAHDNEEEGNACGDCVRKLINWLEKIHARVLWDHSPLPAFQSRKEGNEAIHDILANQICLLPQRTHNDDSTTGTGVDKVIVCGSEVLERYCNKVYATSYVEDIVGICQAYAGEPMDTLKSIIRGRVEFERGNGDFHHILTELAFLQVRRSIFPETEGHGIVPVVFNQINTYEAPMQYLPIFYNTDVKLKLKSTDATSLQRLFFKLLERLFPDDRDFVRSFRECYYWVFNMLELESEQQVFQERFESVLNQGITEAYNRYWSDLCLIIRDGKIAVYKAKVSDKVSRVLEMIDLVTQHEILRWLSPISAPELHGKFHDSGTSRLEGTCDWIIQDEEFRRWYGYDDSALLVYSGNMGTGKTYSTSRVIDWIMDGLSTYDSNEGFAYFYCNKQERMRSEPKEILRNLIRQLAIGPWKKNGRDGSIHVMVHALWEKSQREGISSTFAQWEACLLGLIDAYPRTTIVVDGLDECDRTQRRNLVNLLTALASRREKDSKPVKIFISTRPEDDILELFNNCPTIRMQDKQRASDIETFVRARISQHSEWSSMELDFRNFLTSTLLEKSGDMFLFASLQIDSLLDCCLEEDIREGLQNLPPTLTGTYKEIYNRATNKPTAKKLTDRALRWVMCSARPLTTDELLFAICQDAEAASITATRRDISEKLILKLCQNLLVLDDSRNRSGPQDGSSEGNNSDAPPVWRLAHQAVADFIENLVSSNDDFAHYEAGKVCLMILFDTFGGEPVPRSRTSHEHISGTQNRALPRGGKTGRCRAMKNPLAEYAVYAWPTHVCAQETCKGLRIEEFSETLQGFLGEPCKGSPVYDRWLEYAFGGQSDESPRWSVFATRTMPLTAEAESNINPFSLACYLGFYRTLPQWWESATPEGNHGFYETGAGSWRQYHDMFFDNERSRTWSLVALACIGDQPTILKHLLDRGARLNSTGGDDVPHLVAAVAGNSLESVKELLRRGVEISSPFQSRHLHILHYALSHNLLAIAGLLLDRVFAAVQDIETIMTEMPWAQFGSADAVEMLVDKGVGVDSPLRDGSLLAAAVYSGSKALIHRLLRQGADVNKEFEGVGLACKNALEVALSPACRNLHYDLALPQLLIRSGAHFESTPMPTHWTSIVREAMEEEERYWSYSVPNNL